MTEADRLTGGFFSSYGAGDLLFMVFFGWVAWGDTDPMGPRLPEPGQGRAQAFLICCS